VDEVVVLTSGEREELDELLELARNRPPTKGVLFRLVSSREVEAHPNKSLRARDYLGDEE
jgi:hypothetical protein